MRIAVAYQDGEIYEHFGHARLFAIYDYEGADVTRCTKKLVETGERHGHRDMAELMRGKTANHGSFASTEDVARLGVQIAEALAYAHRCSVVHRDVKPSNIFIGEDGVAKLGDFGLANSVGGGGTRRYMAPELLAGGAATEAGAPMLKPAM